MTRVLIIQGHPDTTERHLDHALAEAYADGARRGGHEVRQLIVGDLDFPLLSSRRAWEEEAPPAIRQAQGDVAWAEHLVLIYPLWLGTMPAMLKGFLEQLFRPGFAFARKESGAIGEKQLTGKSARIVITMGMPALIYRWYFRAHSLKSLERNILHFVGISPVRTTLLGLVEAGGDAKHKRWLAKMAQLGEKAA